MTAAVKNILFLALGNSSRGLMAEALLSAKSRGRFKGYSAGLHPGVLINPFAAELIHALDYPLHELRAKRWNEFVLPAAPRLDFVITLCDTAAEMDHTVWPGKPIVGNWTIADPGATMGSIDNKKEEFKKTFDQIAIRIDQFLALADSRTDGRLLKSDIDGIDCSV